MQDHQPWYRSEPELKTPFPPSFRNHKCRSRLEPRVKTRFSVGSGATKSVSGRMWAAVQERRKLPGPPPGLAEPHLCSCLPVGRRAPGIPEPEQRFPGPHLWSRLERNFSGPRKGFVRTDPKGSQDHKSSSQDHICGPGWGPTSLGPDKDLCKKASGACGVIKAPPRTTDALRSLTTGHVDWRRLPEVPEVDVRCALVGRDTL